ncbi:hypothetical protein FRB98_005428 [Tulasnella sp. 332]|nr:hypothetical protein FRB98_005428 [Tulasnella sp. 332]
MQMESGSSTNLATVASELEPDHRFVLFLMAAETANQRYEEFNEESDLSHSIILYQTALELCPIHHPDRSIILNNLSVALRVRFDKTGEIANRESAIGLGIRLRERFDQTGEMEGLDEAIGYHREQLSKCPVGHPERPIALKSLGIGLRRRFKHTGDKAELDEAIGHY